MLGLSLRISMIILTQEERLEVTLPIVLDDSLAITEEVCKRRTCRDRDASVLQRCALLSHSTIDLLLPWPSISNPDGFGVFKPCAL